MQHSDYQFPFEKLDVWQEARELTKQVYKTTKAFPDEEKFGLVNQKRRAAISVCSNIAEGASRTSKRDQAHFYQIAYSSLMELMNQVIIALDLDYITTNQENEYRVEVGKISRMLNSLRKSRFNN
jgi:four helix bundle protein